MAVDITGYPSLTNFNFATPDTTESSEIIKYVMIDASDFSGDEYIEVVYNSETITIYLTEECRYTPVETHFINKQGAQQTITFFKSREDTLSVTSEEYESDRGQPSDTYHQYIKYNVNARTSFTVNSGFVEEEMNDTFKQLMLSDRIWIVQDGVYVPVNVEKKSLKYKTRQKERLINYEFDFDYSFNEINNV